MGSALRPYNGPWSVRHAAHLARRAGFGGSPADVARLAAMTPGNAVASFVNFSGTAAYPAPDLQVPPLRGRRALMMQQPQAAAGASSDATAEQIKEFNKAANRVRRDNLLALQQWWLDRMIATSAPLQEKMTLFWHSRYTSSIEKGTTLQELHAQNELFRTYALGNARDLTLRVSQDPAMLRYLDNNVNVKAHPNENYARELMELFTLGIGNYSEDDVRESARAFTGWSFRREAGGTAEFVNYRGQHDTGSKTFLGQTGTFDGTDIVRIIYQQPAAARFLAAKLLAFFVYDDPEPELVDAVAAEIRKHDFTLQPVMATLLASNVFFSDRAYRALVKSPVDFVVGTHQLFGIAHVNVKELAVLRAMGQVLFYPPNVKGWDGGAAWINSQTVLTRENFANAVAQNPMTERSAGWLSPAFSTFDARVTAQLLTTTMLQGDASPAAAARLVAYLSGDDQSALAQLSVENVDERVRAATYLTMAMPAYQLA